MNVAHRRTALALATLALLAVAFPAAAWEAVSPTTDQVVWVERDHALPTGLFAATAGGLFHSPDAGETWRLLDEQAFERLATTPADPRTLYALVKEETFVFAVYRSHDGGESFDRSILLGGGFGGRIFDFAVAPGDAELLYASLSTRQGELATSFRTDVQRSTDGGATWMSIRWFPADKADGGKFVFDLEVAPTDPGRLYAATEDGLDRSDDGGDTWVRVRPGGWLHLAIDPLDEDHVLAIAAGAAGVAGGLWETRDAGATWSPVLVSALPEPPPLSAIHFDPIDRTVLYAVAGDGSGAIDRVLASRDAGATWSAVDLPLASPIRQLTVTPTAPRNLLAIAGDRSLERTSFALPLCPERPTALCLHDDRFLVEVAWQDFQGGRGPGFAERLTTDAGTFWFFEPDNVELAVKVLDARTVNDHWWVFFGALTNVELDLRVMDLTAGRSRRYHNPSGRFASRGDTAAFPAGAAPAAAAPGPAWFLMLPGSDVAGACADDATTLCLLDRFRVRVTWQDPTGNGGPGQARPLTTETGWFWFFDANNPELFVKVLDGRPVNGHWWVFYGSLTDVAFDLLVEDTVGGGEASFHHAGGTFASDGDTTALP